MHAVVTVYVASPGEMSDRECSFSIVLSEALPREIVGAMRSFAMCRLKAAHHTGTAQHSPFAEQPSLKSSLIEPQTARKDTSGKQKARARARVCVCQTER